MLNTFSILYYIKKSKADSNGFCNIYLRITVNGKRSELSIHRKIEPQKWNAKLGKMKGSSAKALQLNRYIDSITNKIYAIHQKLVDQNSLISSRLICNIYSGKDQKQRQILEIFENHNLQMEKLVGKEYAAGTLQRYQTAKSHLQQFIHNEYQLQDVPLQEINHQFINGFEYFLKINKNCAHNTAIKYITNFKKVVRIAFANKWIETDPFYNWKARLKTVEKEFLSNDEIDTLKSKELPIKRLDQVRDIFLFSCFTGLAYSDVKKLTINHVVIGIDGEKWINTKRTKTNTKTTIPLLPMAKQILNKYKSESSGGFLLPVLSNQKMNAYLKEIAIICGIHKNLTFHLARHTFATTITLSNGVPIETVSKMLGHTSLKTTQHYAKIIDKKISDDMLNLRKKLSV